MIYGGAPVHTVQHKCPALCQLCEYHRVDREDNTTADPFGIVGTIDIVHTCIILEAECPADECECPVL